MIALGRAYDGVEPNISTGIISATNRIWGKAIQTDAKISAANYGGPLLDLRGQVVGLLVPMSPDDDGVFAGTDWYDSGIGFAIPLNEMLTRLATLKKGTDLRAGLLGVSLKGSDIYADPAIVSYCSSTSPAWKCGIRAGDQIVEVNQIPVDRQSQLKHALGTLYENDEVNLIVEREGKRLSLTAMLAGTLDPFQPTAIGILPTSGFTELDKSNGLEIGFVFPDSEASRAGLAIGDRIVSIQSDPVDDWNQLQQSISQLNPGEVIPLVARRGEAEISIDVPVQVATADLPSGHSRRNPGNGEDATSTDWRTEEIRVSDSGNKGIVLLPRKKESASPAGVLVWDPVPGVLDKIALAKLWQAECAAHNLILLVPESLATDKWQPDEADFVIKAVANLGRRFELDKRRLSIGGVGAGGAMAGLIASQRRDLFRGLLLLAQKYPIESLWSRLRLSHYWFSLEGQYQRSPMIR